MVCFMDIFFLLIFNKKKYKNKFLLYPCKHLQNASINRPSPKEETFLKTLDGRGEKKKIRSRAGRKYERTDRQNQRAIEEKNFSGRCQENGKRTNR